MNACEVNREYVYNLHVSSTSQLANFDSVEKFIYISTDSLFDGQKGDYTESDLVNPLNYYAITKSKGEEVVLKSDKQYAVVRTNIIGFHKPLRNSLFEWAYKSLNEKAQIKGFTNVYFNPLCCLVLAQGISELLHREFEPVFIILVQILPFRNLSF